jgi:HlyD family secretion protein
VYQLNLEEATARHKQLVGEHNLVLESEGAAIAQSELDLRVGKMESERAKRNAETMLVRTPIDGMVVLLTTNRDGAQGQIQQGDSVRAGQPYMSVVDRSSMVVNAAVNQVDAQLLRMGLRAKLRFDAFPELELPGRVTAVGAYAQSSNFRPSYVRKVPIRLIMEKLDPRIIPDLTVSADLELDTLPEATIIPREAMFSAGEDEAPFVFVRRTEGWEKRAIEVLMQNRVAVAVRSGVKPGETLAVEWPEGVPAGPAPKLAASR